MHAIDKASSQDEDYRTSHLEKGRRYDTDLSQSPFDAYMAAWEARLLPEVIRTLYPHGAQRYLDFACGTGRVTSLVAPLAGQSTGVDISPTMIEQARQKCPNTRFRLADLTREDPDLGDFDLITAFRFFGNAQDELREGVLTALSQRLAPCGHLVINSHRNPRALYAWLNRLTGGDRESMDLHLSKLRRLLQRHGLDIVHLRPIGAWMYRTRLMVSTPADHPRALRNESRFGSPMLAGIAPDVIVAARKR